MSRLRDCAATELFFEAKSEAESRAADTVQHARAFRSNSCHNHSLGASSQIDAVLLMFRFKAQGAEGEATPSASHEFQSHGENGGEERRRNKEMQAKKREREVPDRMKRGGLDLCCLCLFKNKARHCALRAGPGRTGRGGRQEGGWGGRMCSLKGESMSHPSATQ